MDKLTEFVKDLLKRGMYISGVGLRNGELTYDLEGFAKSGHGTLFVEDDVIKLETRYNQIDEIHSLSDLVSVAYDWDCGYCSKDSIYTVYGVRNEWRKLYEEFGYNTDNLR